MLGLCVAGAQGVDSSQAAQGAHDLVQDSLVAGVEAGDAAGLAEQGVIAPVAAEHNAQSSVDDGLHEAVANDLDQVGVEGLPGGSRKSASHPAEEKLI